MSQCVRQWSVGSSAQWRGPFGNAPYSANKVRQALYYNCVLYMEHHLPYALCCLNICTYISFLPPLLLLLKMECRHIKGLNIECTIYYVVTELIYMFASSLQLTDD